MFVEKEPECRGGRRPEQVRADALRAPKCNHWYVTAMEEGAQRPTAALKRQRKRSIRLGKEKFIFRSIPPNPVNGKTFIPRVARQRAQPAAGPKAQPPAGSPGGPPEAPYTRPSLSSNVLSLHG